MFILFYFSRGGSGQTSFVSKRYLARGGNVYEGVTVVKLNSTYFWRPVEKTNFTVGIVVAVDDKSAILQKQSVPSGNKNYNMDGKITGQVAK